MSDNKNLDSGNKRLFILGMTSDGKVFRPSDWAERLCGVMSCYRPPGRILSQFVHIAYSPYCHPSQFEGVKCVVVDERLSNLEPKAMNFLLNFARDNDLQLREACLLPELPHH